MSGKTSFFGEEKDREAAKQLGLSNEYTIFFAAVEFEYLKDKYEEEIKGSDIDFAATTIETVKEHLVPVIMPKGMLLVGMSDPSGDNEVYGLVDFSEGKTDQE